QVPHYVLARLRLIHALTALNEIDEAESVVAALPLPEAALAREYATAYFGLGVMAQRRLRPHDAATWFERAAALQPDYPGVHYNLALALQNQGRLHDAMAEYRRELQLDPARSTARRNLAILMQVMGQTGEAIELYREGLAAYPDDVDLHRFL